MTNPTASRSDPLPEPDTLSPAGKVLVTASLPDPGTAPLAQAGLTVVEPAGAGSMSRPELLEQVTDADALLCSLSDRIDAEVLDAATALQVVANFGVGYDNIDMAEIARRGMVATNTPDVLTGATADLTWALLLAVARRLREGDELVRSGGWGGLVPDQPLGLPVGGQTIGIVGLGRIGAAVAARARGFGMRVLYAGSRPSARAEGLGAELVPLDELLAQSDFVSLHAPLTPGTRHLIDAAAIATMKPSAVLVNAGRGPLIDEQALVAALAERRIFGAGLDVYEREPALADGLAALDNVVLSPHVGSATTQARAEMVHLCSENILAVLRDDPPLTPIPTPRP